MKVAIWVALFYNIKNKNDMHAPTALQKLTIQVVWFLNSQN